jgi:hypothetical protein
MSHDQLPPPNQEACLVRVRPSSQKGGTIIAEDVTDRATHDRRLGSPDGYRPAFCPNCGARTLHVHDSGSAPAGGPEASGGSSYPLGRARHLADPAGAFSTCGGWPVVEHALTETRPPVTSPIRRGSDGCGAPQQRWPGAVAAVDL